MFIYFWFFTWIPHQNNSNYLFCSGASQLKKKKLTKKLCLVLTDIKKHIQRELTPLNNNSKYKDCKVRFINFHKLDVYNRIQRRGSDLRRTIQQKLITLLKILMELNLYNCAFYQQKFCNRMLISSRFFFFISFCRILHVHQCRESVSRRQRLSENTVQIHKPANYG